MSTLNNEIHREKDGLIAGISDARGSFALLFSMAVVLSIGVNLSSTALTTLFDIDNKLLLFIGIVLMFSPVVSFGVLQIIKFRKSAFDFSGFFTVEPSLKDKNFKQIVAIPRYGFSEKMEKYFSALCLENKALDRLWQSGKVEFFNFKEEQSEGGRKPVQALVEEATEYFILDRLSSHLNDYFISNRRTPDEALSRFQRHNIPDILLKNRFLELFSKSMDQREVFQKPTYSLSRGESGNRSVSEGSQIVYAVTSGGAIYDNFELILPAKSKVVRTERGSLEIDTSRFKLEITIDFSGYSGVFPYRFENLYLNKNALEVQPFKIDILIRTRFKLFGMLTPRGWGYYQWLDSFVKTMQKEFDFDYFLYQIGWEAALTGALVTEGLSSKKGQAAYTTKPKNSFCSL